jgi:hypothetical protein
MDWSYAFSSIGEAWLGLAGLLLPTPVLAAAALRHRRLVAASPGLLGAAFFVALAVVSGATTISGTSLLGYLPLVALLCCVVLVPFSVMALRNKWLGLFHVLTIAGGLFAMFITAMAIAHDWL